MTRHGQQGTHGGSVAERPPQSSMVGRSRTPSPSDRRVRGTMIWRQSGVCRPSRCEARWPNGPSNRADATSQGSRVDYCCFSAHSVSSRCRKTIGEVRRFRIRTPSSSSGFPAVTAPPPITTGTTIRTPSCRPRSGKQRLGPRGRTLRPSHSSLRQGKAVTRSAGYLRPGSCCSLGPRPLSTFSEHFSLD